METNYVLLMGLFLLLVAVDCSSSDPKGNVNEKTSLNQNVDGTGDPVKDKDDSNSVLDSIGVKKLKDDGGDQINGSEGGSDIDASKSNLNQKSGSNEGENSQKNGKESSVEAKGKKDGDNEHKGKTDGVKEGANEYKGQEESMIEAKGKMDGVKEGDNEHKGHEESNVETKGKKDGVKEGDNEHEGQEESNVEAKGKTDGVKKGDNEHEGQEESNVEAKGKTDGVKEGDNEHKGQEESNVEVKRKTNGEKKGNPDDSVDPKEVKSEKDNTQNSITPPPPPQPTWNDGFRGEECDPSNMCMDNNKRFAACLRVPGNESPDLSLLIQNKGNGPLKIKISAPAFVQLEETNVELQEKEDRKLKVSIKMSGTESLIVLKDGAGECNLDFKDFTMHYSVRRRVLTRIGLKYQKLDMKLPVSGGAKPEPDVNDGWDNSWGDNWDDEEAPMTPSMPVTPPLSSKGLASRRLSKEGWKD